MPVVEPARLIARLAAEGDLLVTAAGRAGWHAPVPGLEWDVRELVRHTGAVHRWAADIVRRQLATNETGGSAAFLPDVPDAELPDWFRTGHTELVRLLSEVGDDVQAWTFARAPSARRFWIRRQLHETAIHRADAEAAAGGPVTGVGDELARDGIHEITGFARGRAFAARLADLGPATLALVATDGPGWHVAFGGERIVVEPMPEPRDADAAVTGSPDELYLWSWNRPSAAAVSGDPEIAGRWRAVRIT